MVSEREIEAAMSGWHSALIEAPDESVYERRRRCIHAALSAAARVRAEDNAGEPVDKPSCTETIHPEWLWYCETTSGSPLVTFGRWPKTPQQRRYKLAEIQPTEHDHPAPQPSGRVEVKPLEWRGTEGVWAKADALFGATYRITEYAGMAKPFKLETVGFVGPSGHYELLTEAKAAAQADYERRILSALTAGKPEQECATEGCDKPATYYFERGGVGSHYCHGCYVKVQAVTTPPTAGGGDA